MAGTDTAMSTKDAIPYSPEMRNVIRSLRRQASSGYRGNYGELGLVAEIAQKLQAYETLLVIAEEHKQYADYHRYNKWAVINRNNLESAKRAHEREHHAGAIASDSPAKPAIA